MEKVIEVKGLRRIHGLHSRMVQNLCYQVVESPIHVSIDKQDITPYNFVIRLLKG